MAKTVNDSPLASLLPDEMISGGLPDDFDGVVREARYAPWDYNGKIDTPVLAIMLKIERLEQGLEEDDRYVTQHFSAGSLDHFRPSTDGVNPTGGEGMGIEPGFFALRVGQRTALGNNTNTAQLMRSLLDAQVPRDKFRPDVRFIEGIKGHWNRLPQDRKNGQFKDEKADAGNRKPEVLCLTRFDGFDGGTTAAAAPKGGSPTVAPTVAASAPTGTIDAKLTAIVAATVKVGAPAMKKTALSGAVLKAAKADKDVQKMVKRVTETEFLQGLAEVNILYDADAGTVEAIAVE